MQAASRAPSPARALIGTTPAMRKLQEAIARVGPHPWPLLILGETGTGKELVARNVHSHSGGPFVVIDCSALVGSLMESELFGHVKGAFTGASGRKPGLIEMADGGSAFFDEVGELPLDIQGKLLRVLQEKEFRPVGSVVPRRSDFRVIAATNRDLRAEVQKGRFREDLYYRLKVVTLRTPPLRERREDIALLVEHFLSKYGPEYNFDPQLLQAIATYDWHGNVRELENCVQHGVAHCKSKRITLEDMPTLVANHVIGLQSGMVNIDVLAMAAALGTSTGDKQTVVPLEDLERRHILAVLDYTKGDRAAAASLLNIGRTTLYRKLKAYGVRTD